MYLVKKAILKSYRAAVTLLSYAVLAVLLNVLAGMELLAMDGLERHPLLNAYFILEKRFEAPVTDLLRSWVPTTVAAYDLAPLLLAVGLLVLWIVCESDRYRLRMAEWNLTADHKFRLAEEAAARERARMLAALEEAETAAALRARRPVNDVYTWRADGVSVL